MILWILWFVALISIIFAMRQYFKTYVFKYNTFFTKKTSKLFRKTGIVYIECLRLYGCFFEKPLLFLVDTGATSNFIRQDVVENIDPDYIKHIEYSDDIMTVNGTMTLNRIIDVPAHFAPSLKCKIPFTLLTQTESLQYLSSECKENVVGIIGTEFLKEHGININFKLL